VLDFAICGISIKHIEAVRDYLQTSLTRLMTWFGDLGLSLSANKSEMMIFSRKHENPQVLVRLGQTAFRNVTEFKYLGIIFDSKVTWRLHAEYATQGLFYEEHCGPILGCPPSLSTVVYKSTVLSVIEYGGCASLGCLTSI
jgi:hypothetical protein